MRPTITRLVSIYAPALNNRNASCADPGCPPIYHVEEPDGSPVCGILKSARHAHRLAESLALAGQTTRVRKVARQDGRTFATIYTYTPEPAAVVPTPEPVPYWEADDPAAVVTVTSTPDAYHMTVTSNGRTTQISATRGAWGADDTLHRHAFRRGARAAYDAECARHRAARGVA